MKTKIQIKEEIKFEIHEAIQGLEDNLCDSYFFEALNEKEKKIGARRNIKAKEEN